MNLIDSENLCDVMWVDLYEIKEVSKKILNDIESKVKDATFYRTSIIKENNVDVAKESDVKVGITNLLKEIDEYNPKIIFILGNEVADILIKNVDYIDSKVIMINHPLYVYQADKENTGLYISDVVEIIKNNIK